MLDDDVWTALQEIPPGERSRFLNEAAAHELLRRQREAAIERMDAVRATMVPVPGTSEEWIREDRESH
ncbi:MAG: hypothetical protein FIA97_00025 [Methylococcaceae bacterium]|nr:hypothetical protein [Methylococcaceae bacterium]